MEPNTAAAAAISSFQLTDYYPPAEAAGGWRKTADPAQILGLGIDPSRLAGLGSYLMALPHENYAVGVTGYDPTNKAAIVIKNGWIVGEYYNKASAATGVYYLASNGKTFAILLAGRMARDQAQLGLTGDSKLYDQRWLPQGFPLTDARKADITFDQVFRHASGIIPEIEQSVASGAVQPGTKWNFDLFTVGRDADYPATRPLYYTPGNPGAYAKGSAYSSVAFNHLSLVFRNVTGLEPGEYLRQAMLQPIGVGRMAYKTTVGMGDYRWAAAGNGLASARDFARIAYLMLHEGAWDGNEIVPAGWLRQFTTAPHYRNIRSNIDCRWGARFPADMYRTTGSGLNWLLVVPSLDLVLTFNGRTPSSQAVAVDTTSLKRLFDAVTERYVACDGSVINDTPPPEPDNEPPSADFSVSCRGLDCTFGDGGADTDGTLASWSWSFGDGGTSTEQSPSHSYAEAGSYTVTLTVTDDDGGTGSQSRTVAAGTGNAPPAADFESSCSGLSCDFTDRSADSDGGVQGWSWQFGDGATSSEANPSHQYAAGGSYQVTLQVTDNAGATHQTSAAVAVAAPAIALSATGREDATKQYMVLRWSGAVGAKVDIYRNDVRVNTTDNDGRHTINRVFTGPATYDMKLCQAKSPVCSDVVRLVFD